MTHPTLESTIGGKLIGFIHALRKAEFNVSTQEVVVMGQALSHLDEPDADASRHVMRALCCQSRQQWKQFNTLFDRYWINDNNEIDLEALAEENPFGNKIGVVGIASGAHEEVQPDDSGAGGGAGKQTAISKADFRFLKNVVAMKRIEILADRLAYQIRPILSRRREATKKAGQLALGPTLRQSIRTAGEPMVPWFSRRKTEPPHLVILHDVSHSMTFNNPLLFRFTRSLVKRFSKSDAFVFHTRLYCVTPILKLNAVSQIQSILERNNRLWLGGTCIADSLREFRENFADQTIRRSTILLIVSDGFDSNDPEQLASELKALKYRCRKLIWMNPMLGREGFNPNKDSVYNIKRNVDSLLPAHSLDALRQCVTVIGRQ